MIDTHLRAMATAYLRLVAGYSAAEQALFAVDPIKPPPGLRVVRFADLDAVLELT